MPTSSLLLGSIEGLPAQSLELSINNDPSQTVSIPSGNYYLDDTSAALSLLAVVAAEMALDHTEDPNMLIVILQNRKVRISHGSGVEFAITWTDTTLRDALGFTGNLTGANAYTATNPSRYLWAPGKTESPLESILGVNGRRVKDTRFGQSGLTGRVITTTNDTRVQNRFQWLNVTPTYYWTDDELGGEWQSFWDTVASEGLRFKLYQNVTIDESSTTAITLSSDDQLGPYKMRPPGGPISFDVERAEQYLDNNFTVDLPVAVSPEYT